MATVEIGSDTLTLEEYSAFKALRAMRIVKDVLEEYPDLQEDIQEFVRKYEATYYVDLPRSQALWRYGPERLGHLTDEDWQQSGQKLRLPRSPSGEEQVLHIFPKAFDLAEEKVLQIAALALIPNAELEAADLNGGEGEVEKLIAEKARPLPHRCKADQLVELFVVATEQAEEQIGEKVRALQERLGNALKLFGLGRRESKDEPTPEPSAEPSTDPGSATEGSPTRPPSSSTSASSAGTDEPSSIEPAGSSRSSSGPS